MTLRNTRIGRPRKAPGERRDERLPAPRVTAAELAYVHDLAERAGVDVAEFCRQAILRQHVTPRRSAASSALLYELNKAGVNLNQIARAVNRGRDLPPHFATVLDELRTVLEQVADDEAPDGA